MSQNQCIGMPVYSYNNITVISRYENNIKHKHLYPHFGQVNIIKHFV